MNINISRRNWTFILTGIFTSVVFWLLIKADALEVVGRAFTQLNVASLLILGLFFTGMRLMQALSLSWMLHLQKTKVNFSHSLDLVALKGFYNLGLSGAGLVAQALRARASKLFSIKQLAWATLLQSLLLISALGLLLAISAWTLLYQEFPTISLITAAIIATLIPFAILNFVQRGLIPNAYMPAFFRQPLADLTDLLQKCNIKQIAVAWIIQVVLVSFRISRIIFVAIVLDSEESIGALATITLAADLATVIPLTPGGIGIREVLIGIGGDIVGSFELFISAAIIDRAITILGNLVHGSWVLAKDAFATASAR